MKKVLITGAAGIVGLDVIKYALSEGKYEITVLDLKNSKTKNKLKKYSNRVNIVYGDICNRILMEALIKDHDIVIHLVTVPPVLGMIKKELTKSVEYDALENITRSINYYNPTCKLIYLSSTSVYGECEKEVSASSKLKIDKLNYFAKYKADAEKLIKDKLQNYTIVRSSMILSHTGLVYNVKCDSNVNFITSHDAAYALVSLIKHSKMYNKKTININGNDSFNIKYGALLRRVIQINGLTLKLFLTDLFIDKLYTSPVCIDSKENAKVLEYQNENIDDYFETLKTNAKSRSIPRFFGKIYLLFKRKV